MIKIKVRHLIYTGLLLLSLPAAVFLLTWIRLYAGIPALALLCAGLFFAFRSVRKQFPDQELELDRVSWILLLFLPVLWAVLTGHGGFLPQKGDMIWRNAVFRDMITHEWPVLYNGGAHGLVYYVGYWLIPAGAGKIVYAFAGLDAAWRTANILVLIWTCLHLWVTVSLCLVFTGTMKRTAVLVTCGVFILFSGMDYPGLLLCYDWPLRPNQLMHIEWWRAPFQYSSMTTQLGWVFNQAVPTWLTVMLYLFLRRKTDCFALLLLFLIPCGPFPAVGIAVFMIADGFRLLYRSFAEHKKAEFWKDVFSISNITAVMLLPIFYLYYFSNVSAGGLMTTPSVSGMPADILFMQRLKYLRSMLPVFWLLEFGLLAFCLGTLYRKRFLWIVSTVQLLLIPFLVYNSIDMVMRISIPGLFILMLLTIRYLLVDSPRFQRYGSSRLSMAVKYTRLAVIFFLLAGAVTAVTEIRATFIETKTYDQGTMEGSGVNPNFMSSNPRESLFFRYLAADSQPYVPDKAGQP